MSGKCYFKRSRFLGIQARKVKNMGSGEKFDEKFQSGIKNIQIPAVWLWSLNQSLECT